MASPDPVQPTRIRPGLMLPSSRTPVGGSRAQ